MRFVKHESSFTAKTGERAGVAKHFTPWTDIFEDCKYIIPYRIDKKISNNQQGDTAMKTAFEKLESNSSLKFVEQTDQERYLYFTDGNGCRSYVGQQKKTGPQSITLGRACWYYYTIIHEVDAPNKALKQTFQIMHALGFQHEHQRPDRDDYIQVLIENVTPYYQYEFKIIMNDWSPYNKGKLLETFIKGMMFGIQF